MELRGGCRNSILFNLDYRNRINHIRIFPEEESSFGMMSMYCPECGTENKDAAKFCLDCGARIKPKAPEVKPAPTQQRTEKMTEFSPIIVLILIGIVIILGLYLIPLGQTYFGTGITLSKMVEMCSSPSPFIRCNNTLFWMYYIGWLLGLGCIVIGIFHKNEI